MWVKITSIEQLASLHEGSMVAIYPLQGAPSDSFDESDPEQVSHRLVSENYVEENMLTTTALQRKDEARILTPAGMGGIMFSPGGISYVDIIEQGAWWMQQGY